MPVKEDTPGVEEVVVESFAGEDGSNNAITAYVSDLSTVSKASAVAQPLDGAGNEGLIATTHALVVASTVGGNEVYITPFEADGARPATSEDFSTTMEYVLTAKGY